MSIKMVLKILLRQKIVLILIFLIPLLFLFVVDITSTNNILPIKFPSIESHSMLLLPERQISLTYYSITTCGFLVSFLGMYLVQQNKATNKRLILCGYHPTELLISILLVLITIIIIIAVYIGGLASLFHKYNDLFGFMTGLALIGFVYGSYGLFIGGLLRKEIEGILALVLLVNIDAGWLQNPILYTQSENKVFIQLLPAHYPSQSAIIQAFTDYSTSHIDSLGILYGLFFLMCALVMFYYKMRVFRFRKH